MEGKEEEKEEKREKGKIKGEKGIKKGTGRKMGILRKKRLIGGKNTLQKGG